MLRPFRLTIQGIGLLLARLGLINTRRALRTSDLAWPRIITGIARMSKSTADVAMVGTALGASAIAGVGFATPFWALAFMLGGGIAGGTISLVSQRHAARDRQGTSVAIKVSALMSLTVTLPLVVLFWFLAEPLVGLIGSGSAAVDYGARYLRVVSLAMPFAAVNLVGSRALVGTGDAWSPMVIRASGAVVNIALNALFIFVLDLGVAGAALGTVLSAIMVTTAFTWGLLAGRLPGLGDLPLRVALGAPHVDRLTARHMVQIATPLALTNFVRGGGQFPLLAIVSFYGPEVVAALVIALRVRDLMNTPGWGFGLASSSLVGQALGTGREREAAAYARDVLRYAVAVYAISASLVFALATPVSHLFVNDPALVPIAAMLIRATCVSVLLWGIMNGAMGPLRASGDTQWPFYGQVLGLLAFTLPLAYLGAVSSLGLMGLCLALVFETGVPAAVAYYRYQSETWQVVSRTFRPASVSS